MEKRGGQHDKAKDGSNAEIDAQTAHADGKHFIGSAEGHQNLLWEYHDDQPDDAGDSDGKYAGQIEGVHDPFVISGAEVVPEDGLDPLADAAGGHDDEGHDAGYHCIDADGDVTAVFSKLAVVYQTDESHGHLGHPEGKSAGDDFFGQAPVKGKGEFVDAHHGLSLKHLISAEEGGKNLSDDCGPRCTGDAPIQDCDEKSIQDNVGDGAYAGDAHSHDGFSGHADEITKDLGQPLEQTAQGYDPIIGDGIFIGRFSYAKYLQDGIGKQQKNCG